MSKKFYFLVGVVVLLTAAVVLVKESSLGASFLWKISDEGAWLLPLIVVSSLIDSINPCAFSVLLITVAFLFGVGADRSKMLRIGAAYIAGIFVVYVLIGLGILRALSFFGIPHFMAKFGATLVILFGIVNLLGYYFPSFPIKFRIPALAHSRMASLVKRGSALAAFLLGGLVALCEFPCTGGPYLTALGLLHDKSAYLSGFGYLLLYNLIFVAPLVVALLVSSEGSLIAKLESWKKDNLGRVKVITGFAMIALGVVIFWL